VREILKYPAVRAVTLVDLDPEMTRLFASHSALTALNGRAFTDRRVRVVNEDAFIWLDRQSERFDVVIIDLPDPHSFSLGKLYTRSFYRLLRSRLAPGGLAAIQATSPLFARRSFWCIVETIGSAGLAPHPYHIYVPAFGAWGFVLAATGDYRPPRRYPEGLRYLTVEGTPALFVFPPDMARLDVEVNRLDNQILVQYYGEEWRRVFPSP
jgi:spermidine synthase